MIVVSIPEAGTYRQISGAPLRVSLLEMAPGLTATERCILRLHLLGLPRRERNPLEKR